jgi:hypothetical protein
MTIEQLKAWFVSRGYSQDKYGHYQKTLTIGDKSNTYRYKIQDISIRKEVQITVNSYNNTPVHEWVRLASGYISKLSINDKNQLVGLKA